MNNKQDAVEQNKTLFLLLNFLIGQKRFDDIELIGFLVQGRE